MCGAFTGRLCRLRASCCLRRLPSSASAARHDIKAKPTYRRVSGKLQARSMDCKTGSFVVPEPCRGRPCGAGGQCRGRGESAPPAGLGRLSRQSIILTQGETGPRPGSGWPGEWLSGCAKAQLGRWGARGCSGLLAARLCLEPPRPPALGLFRHWGAGLLGYLGLDPQILWARGLHSSPFVLSLLEAGGIPRRSRDAGQAGAWRKRAAASGVYRGPAPQGCQSARAWAGEAGPSPGEPLDEAKPAAPQLEPWTAQHSGAQMLDPQTR